MSTRTVLTATIIAIVAFALWLHFNQKPGMHQEPNDQPAIGFDQ